MKINNQRQDLAFGRIEIQDYAVNRIKGLAICCPEVMNTVTKGLIKAKNIESSLPTNADYTINLIDFYKTSKKRFLWIKQEILAIQGKIINNSTGATSRSFFISDTNVLKTNRSPEQFAKEFMQKIDQKIKKFQKREAGKQQLEIVRKENKVETTELIDQL